MDKNNMQIEETIRKFSITQDDNLREEIILHFVPLVHYVLGRMGAAYWNGCEYDDLASQGIMGLIEAVDRYDLNEGTQLSTYATLKIRGKILDYLREQDWLPRNARQKMKLVHDAAAQLQSKYERTPTNEEIANLLDFDVKDVEQAYIDSSRIVISIDDDREETDEGDSVSLYESIADSQQSNPSETSEQTELKDQMVNAIKLLPMRDQQVLSLYYFEELTFKEIGEVLEVSESRVCQIHGRAVTRLKQSMSNLMNNQSGDGITYQLDQARNNYRSQTIGYR